MLNVLSIRLGRVVDRARIVERKLVTEQHAEHITRLQSEVEALWKRIRLVNWSLRMFVCAALLICFVIVTLFFGELRRYDLSVPIATLFIGTMLFMITGLVLFLFEVSVSTRRIREVIVEILEES